MTTRLRWSIRQAWMQMWMPAPAFASAKREQAFLHDFCRRFATHRRLAILLGLSMTLVYLAWDFIYGAGDPMFKAMLGTVFWNRIGTAFELLPFLALAATRRFAHDEKFASAVLLAGVFVNFLFYCRGFLAVPYPYDYMFFFMGMFINVVFGFAMLRLRARPVLLLMGLCLLAATLTFAWNWHIKQAALASHPARIYQWVAFSFLLTIATIGFVVANLLERSSRDSFASATELAATNAALSARNTEFERVNTALGDAVTRARRESAARTQVLASASHDLRQPLHALSLYSAVLAANPVPEVLREVGANIDRLVHSLGDLLHGLLDLSQLSSGHYAPTAREFAAHGLLEEICGEFEQAAAAKGLALRRQLAPAVLVGDPLALSRIARNLIDNAIKYTEAGHVQVRLAHGGTFTELVVEDTGKGIAAQLQPRVFEEFFQIDNPTRERGRGVGLGLTIVQRLAELMGATVTLRSAHGAGSSFTLRMPRGKEAQPHAAARAPADAGPGGGAAVRKRVYVVDDEPDILHGMRALLATWHCEVHVASNAAETAALMARHGPPHLLIADLRLRGATTGLVLAERMIARHGPFPVVFISGETASDTLRDARARGWQVLYKPVGADVLRRAIHAVPGGDA